MSESHPKSESRRPFAGQRMTRAAGGGTAKARGAGLGPAAADRPLGLPRIGMAVASAQAMAEATAVVWESPGWR